jgi:hypothetical protein
LTERTLEQIWTGSRLRGIQDGIGRGELAQELCRECRGTLYEIDTGRIISNSDRSLVEKAAAFVKSYGVSNAVLRAVTELEHRLRSRWCRKTRGTAGRPWIEPRRRDRSS